MTTVAHEIQYLVLPDPTNPYLLARVRWPDVFQALSPARPYWQADPGLFDLPYDSSATTVTFERAVAIATQWGARLLPDERFGDDSVAMSQPSLMRRMPADWSNLSRAEKRAWSIDLVETDIARSNSRRARRRRRKQGVIDLTDAADTRVIDLTDTRDDARATVEDA